MRNALEAASTNLTLITEVNKSVKNLSDAQIATTSTLRALIVNAEGFKRDVKVLKDENKDLKKKIRDLERKYVNLMEKLNGTL